MDKPKSIESLYQCRIQPHTPEAKWSQHFTDKADRHEVWLGLKWGLILTGGLLLFLLGYGR